MPHIATWWCGQKSAREEVLSRLDDIAIESAYGRSVPGFPANGPVLAGQLAPADRERLVGAISDRGIDYVGQELVRLSTTPVLGERPPRRRVPSCCASLPPPPPNGWDVMPGGFCRIAEQPDARAVSMGDGARAADVWVVSDKAVQASTLLPAVDTVRIRRIAGVLPSRAADNLFWLGRYLERAEATLRLIRALGSSLRESRQGRLRGRGSQTGSSASSACSSPGARRRRPRARNRPRSPPKRCRARNVSARRCRWCAPRSAPPPPCANGCRRTPGR